jgi:DevC protein
VQHNDPEIDPNLVGYKQGQYPVTEGVRGLRFEQDDQPQSQPQPQAQPQPHSPKSMPSSAPQVDVSTYDVQPDFTTFDQKLKSSTETLKVNLQRTIQNKILGKKIVVRASKGYKQPEADYTVVAEALRQHLPEDVEVMTIEEFIEDELKYWQEESPIGFIFTLGTGMAFVVGVVIVYQVLSTDVSAHIKEYATFKAMGYRHRYLLAVVFEEAVILAFLGFIPGLILPIGLYHVAAKATSLPIMMTQIRAITVLLLTLIMCVMSGAIATQKLQSADPADMF